MLGGIDESGKEVTNEVTRLILETVEELPISDFPISVRVNADSPESLLKKMAEVIRHGGGVVAMYDEASIINGMTKCGYSEREARKFANDGCWEVQVPGATNFAYIPFDGLQIFNRAIGLKDDSPERDFKNIDEIFAAFKSELQKAIDEIFKREVTDAFVNCINESYPTTVVDVFTDGCIENVLAYDELGPRYTVHSPHFRRRTVFPKRQCRCSACRRKKPGLFDSRGNVGIF